MNMDSIDLDLFLYFLENGTTTHTVVDIVKNIFGDISRDEMIKKTSMINYRLKKWCKQEYFTCEIKNNIKYYTIALKGVYYEDNCILSTAIETLNLGKALILEMVDNTYIVHFLNE